MALTALLPRVVYGPGPTTFNFTLPMKPWDLKNKTFGGYGKSSTGVPESLLIRRERWLTTTLRFYESQLGNVQDWLEYVIDNAASFTFRLNQADAATDYVVYLEKPHMKDDDVDLKRSGDYLGAYELDVTITTIAGARFTTAML
jgi:hypothetical protein